MQLSLEAAVSRPVPGLINTSCDELEYPLLPYQLKQNSKVYLNIEFAAGDVIIIGRGHLFLQRTGV